jgi:hypothetical protein
MNANTFLVSSFSYDVLGFAKQNTTPEAAKPAAPAAYSFKLDDDAPLLLEVKVLVILFLIFRTFI